jgi:hypothetical protein
MKNFMQKELSKGIRFVNGTGTSNSEGTIENHGG